MKTLRILCALSLAFLFSTTFGQVYEIWVSDAGNYNDPPWQILKFDENGENPVAIITDSIVWPQDIVFLEDEGVVLISSLTSPGYISRHDINSGEFINYFADSIAGPTRMEIGADSLLYVLQWSNTNNKVLRYHLDGTFEDEFTSVGVPQSIGLAWDNAGNLYVSSYGWKYVQKFDTDGNDMGTFISTNLAGPTNIWFDDNGDLLVVDYNGGSVKRFDADGVYIGIYISGLNNPEGFAFYPNGNLLLGNGGTHAVKLFDDMGTFIEDFIPAGSGDLITPNAVRLRDVTATSVVEAEITESFIFPSAGRIFTINPNNEKKLNTYTIFDTAGVQIDQLQFMGTGTWNARDLPDGVYVVVADCENGKIISQKIVVK